jgi:hypothetical protein
MTEQTDIGEILEQRPPEPAQDVGAPADDGIARDDKGRFAPREPKAEVAAEPTGEVAAPPAAPSSPPEGYVPLAALIDHRLEARQAKQERDELRRQLAEAQKPKQEPVDFYADPDAAFTQRIQSALSPYQQQLQETRSQLFEERLHRVAGSEKAALIEQEIAKAAEAGEPDFQMLATAIQTQGINGVKTLVDWYERRTFDPAAKEAEIEARILAKHGITPGQVPAKPAPVMPSNLAGARNVGTRSGVPWAGPRPLQDIFKQ